MALSTQHNDDFINFWNNVLVDKFERFRNILMDGMSYHSDTPLKDLALPPAARVLDVGCGWGDTALALAKKVGAGGRVTGLDCCDGFLEKGRQDARRDEITNIEFIAADVQTYPFEPVYDLCFSRFGMMFFSNPVAAMKNIYRALKPGGELLFITWRTLEENPWLSAGKNTVLDFLPPPGENAQVCGPGPFSMSDPDLVTRQLQAAGYTDIRVEPMDGPVMVGRDIAQAIDFQLAIGPAGEIYREAGELANRRRPIIEHALEASLGKYSDDTGRIIMDSASWCFRAHRPGQV